jgi:hypothetical protein
MPAVSTPGPHPACVPGVLFLCLLPQTCHAHLCIRKLTLQVRQLPHGSNLPIKVTRATMAHAVRLLLLLLRLQVIMLLLLPTCCLPSCAGSPGCSSTAGQIAQQRHSCCCAAARPADAACALHTCRLRCCMHCHCCCRLLLHRLSCRLGLCWGCLCLGAGSCRQHTWAPAPCNGAHTWWQPSSSSSTPGLLCGAGWCRQGPEEAHACRDTSTGRSCCSCSPWACCGSVCTAGCISCALSL